MSVSRHSTGGLWLDAVITKGEASRGTLESFRFLCLPLDITHFETLAGLKVFADGLPATGAHSAIIKSPIG
jgi:hypothetical protein